MLQACRRQGDCVSIPVVQSLSGIDMAVVPLGAFDSQYFAIQAGMKPMLAVTVMDLASSDRRGPKSQITNESPDPRRWILSTDLSYTFEDPDPPTQPSFITIAFTLAMMTVPVITLKGAHPLLTALSATDGLERLQHARLFTKISYALVVLYATVLNGSLVYYWAGWKLIPYSKFLIYMVLTGSVTLLVSLADLEGAHGRGENQKSVEKPLEKSVGGGK
eukprot:Blabericola_migrator_1__1086@NODE_1277_length_4911_cov_28_619116_g862_i0_p3_GENE_NODE_1277_length_4911_cov_28_619116_g862_i0NODE_1277_length_4911_cov_28_619116_g862_i0_p3_ORF_typecomplete_len219_score17_06Ribophorin_II/PF05817_14/3_1e05DUF2678/PF10856_8/6_5e02DUF2678/PF10856_8/0_24SNARE_assoc/PF09335_11/0_16DUF3149/PF11346_8/0_4_NODE_1277_length_4911_cov_28_619116_g862_i028353491